MDIDVAPRQRVQITLPYNGTTLKKDSEYFVTVQFILKDNKPWAEKSFVTAEEQILVKELQIVRQSMMWRLLPVNWMAIHSIMRLRR